MSDRVFRQGGIIPDLRSREIPAKERIVPVNRQQAILYELMHSSRPLILSRRVLRRVRRGRVSRLRAWWWRRQERFRDQVC